MLVGERNWVHLGYRLGRHSSQVRLRNIHHVGRQYVKRVRVRKSEISQIRTILLLEIALATLLLRWKISAIFSSLGTENIPPGLNLASKVHEVASQILIR